MRSVHWSPDDAHIVSAGRDGAVYEWRLKDFKREKENVLKGCNYTSVLSTPDCKTLYAAGVWVVCLCTYMCICFCRHMCVCLCMYDICVFVYVCACACVCKCVCLCECVYVWVC